MGSAATAKAIRRHHADGWACEGWPCLAYHGSVPKPMYVGKAGRLMLAPNTPFSWSRKTRRSMGDIASYATITTQPCRHERSLLRCSREEGHCALLDGLEVERRWRPGSDAAAMTECARSLSRVGCPRACGWLSVCGRRLSGHAKRGGANQGRGSRSWHAATPPRRHQQLGALCRELFVS